MNQNYNPLPPIPTPPGQRWREFRIQVLPAIIFVAGLVAATFIWKQNIAGPTLQGEVEAIQAQVATPQAGVLTQLKVSRFQLVSKGEEIAVVTPTDPRASLALIQSEIDILRARIEPRLTLQRNATDHEKLRLDWLLQKLELATTRVELARAENELKRKEELFKAKLISDELYDLSLKRKEALQIEVEERTKLVADLGQGLQRLSLMANSEASSSIPDDFLGSIKAEEEKLRLTRSKLGPIIITAPISGMVSVVYRQAGENLRDGDPIAAIRAPQSDRIVGYLRQPFPIEPEIGMNVEVRNRAQRPMAGLGHIVQVGSQVEPIASSLAATRPGIANDMGLPIAVSLPPAMKMYPGEIVDLVIRSRK